METMIAVEQPKKRVVKRATARPGESKTKIGLVISDRAAKRLGLQSLMTGEDRSALVEQLILKYCNGWKVSRTGPDHSPTQDLSVDES